MQNRKQKQIKKEQKQREINKKKQFKKNLSFFVTNNKVN